MRLLLPILLIFCLFSVAEANIFEDILKSIGDWWTKLETSSCERLKKMQETGVDTAYGATASFTGFFRGIFLCGNQNGGVTKSPDDNENYSSNWEEFGKNIRKFGYELAYKLG